MEPTTEKAKPARTIFLVVKRSGIYDVYQNNIGIRYGLNTRMAADTICESKARNYSHEKNLVMRQSTYESTDVGPNGAKLGQAVWAVGD